MEVCTHLVTLPLRHTFTIAHGSQTEVQSLIVELIDGEHHGYGETQAIDYYGVSTAQLKERVDQLAGKIGGLSWDEPPQLWEALQDDLGDANFALCAIDQAAHDLWGKRLGKPVYELWGLDTKDNVASDYTIGIDDIEVMVKKLAEFPGWPIYKIKLGTERDIEIVAALREHTDATFRIDANCAWTAEQCLEYAGPLKELGVEFLEQPLAAEDWEGMQRVFAECALPVIADESCILESDVRRCAGSFHGINIKLTKCGGLTPARRMIAEARSLGMSCMVGCMTESSVGISAIAQLVPLLDYVDMDGAVLLGRDIAEGVSLDKGRIAYPARPGHGVVYHGL